jgi:hypothetical protein
VRTPNEALEQLEEDSAVVREIEGTPAPETTTPEETEEESSPAYVFPATVRPPTDEEMPPKQHEAEGSSPAKEDSKQTLRLEAGKETVAMDQPRRNAPEEPLKEERQYGS